MLRIRGNGDEEEEQEPRGFYSGERWGATHQKWRWSGWDTQTLHAVEINSAMVRFLRERQRGNKGEERGFARRDRRAGDHVHKRRKEGEEGGSGTRDKA